MLGSLIEGKRLNRLLSGPRGSRVRWNVEVNDPVPVMSEHDEATEDAERDRGHREGVDRRAVFQAVFRNGRQV
jgi:hypothetical protein